MMKKVEPSRVGKTIQFDRKDFLRWAGLGVGTLLGACSLDSAENLETEGGAATSSPADLPQAGGGVEAPRVQTARRDPEAESRVRQVLEAYSNQGVHRTGTEGDLECARWLAEAATHAGARVEVQMLEFPRLDPEDCHVEIGGGRISGIPIFNAPSTSAGGLTGRLGTPGSGADIAFLAVPPNGSGGQGFEELRLASAERAILAVTGGPRYGLPEGFALLNAEGYPETFGPPAIQLPSSALATLEAAAKDGAEVHVVNAWQRTMVTVDNTVATVEGSRPDLEPLIVMTPRSGWWQCASERGGGIAVWLEMMRALARERPSRTTHFVASTGHELGHWGLDRFLEERQSWFGESIAWIHLGANFGSADGGPDGQSILLQSSDDEARRIGLETMALYGRSPDREALPGQRPVGEARNVFDGGGRYLSLLGRNGRFHHPSDQWPDAVDVGAVVDLAAAFSDIALQLAADESGAWKESK